MIAIRNSPAVTPKQRDSQSALLIYHDCIEGIVAAMDARDPYTASHSQRVSDIVLLICTTMRLCKSKALPPSQCRHELEKNAGVMYDPRITECVLKNWVVVESVYDLTHIL